MRKGGGRARKKWRRLPEAVGTQAALIAKLSAGQNACIAAQNAFDEALRSEKRGYIPLGSIRITRIINAMQSVIEHPTFIKPAAKIWSEGELHAFVDWIAANPLAGKHDSQ